MSVIIKLSELIKDVQILKVVTWVNTIEVGVTLLR